MLGWGRCWVGGRPGDSLGFFCDPCSMYQLELADCLGEAVAAQGFMYAPADGMVVGRDGVAAGWGRCWVGGVVGLGVGLGVHWGFSVTRARCISWSWRTASARRLRLRASRMRRPMEWWSVGMASPMGGGDAGCPLRVEGQLDGPPLGGDVAGLGALLGWGSDWEFIGAFLWLTLAATVGLDGLFESDGEGAGEVTDARFISWSWRGAGGLPRRGGWVQGLTYALADGMVVGRDGVADGWG